MNYNEYTIEDYLSDEHFQDWVYSGKKTDFVKKHDLEKEEQKKIIKEAVHILESMAPKKRIASEGEISTQWELLKNEIEQSNNGKKHSLIINPRWNRVRRNSWFKYAATVGFIVVSIIVYFFGGVFEPTVISHQTKVGEKKVILLEDGTNVNLNSSSVMKVDEKAGREVWLDGEAFFNVKEISDLSNLKFTVHAGSLDIIVLGTEFNVLHRNNITKIALKEGSVMLRTSNGTERVMEKGQVLVYNLLSNEFSMDQKEHSYYYAWLEDKIILDDTSVAEIAQILDNKFGVRVTILDPNLKHRKLSGIVSDNDMNVILDAIKNSLDVQIRQNENGIEIY